MSWRGELPALATAHIHYSDGVHWRLTATGIAVNGGVAAGTPGPPDTARRVWLWFGREIVIAARVHDVPVELIIAVICTESAGGIFDKDACQRARRTEPGWISDDATPDRVSVGCMQTLISTATSVTPYIRPHLTALLLQTAQVSIDAGTAVISRDFAKHRFDAPLVAACYNAGGIYFEPAAANRWRLRCYPPDTGAYIDRFVSWFNDAMALPEGARNANGAPAFAQDRFFTRSPGAVGA